MISLFIKGSENKMLMDTKYPDNISFIFKPDSDN